MTARSLFRIFIYASVLSGAIAAVLIIPLARNAYAAHKQHQKELRYGSGLTPCSSDGGYFASYMDGHLPGPPDIAIDVFPTFSAPEALRIVGQDIFFFRVKDRLVANSGVHTYRMTLSQKRSEELVSVLTNEVAMAHEVERSEAGRITPIDGVTYYFRVGQTARCATGRISTRGSRAEQVVDLYYALINYTTNSAAHPITEFQLRSEIEALKRR